MLSFAATHRTIAKERLCWGKFAGTRSAIRQPLENLRTEAEVGPTISLTWASIQVNPYQVKSVTYVAFS